jgi:iron complex outermembrane receptor protein
VPTGGSPYVSQAYSLGSETAGNPDVKPIKSKSYTAGAVFTPFSDIDLTATVDYYWIQEAGIIWNPSSGGAIDDYLSGAPLPAGVSLQFDGPDPLHPNAPLRPINVIGLFQNQNKIDTSGVDFEVKGGTDIADSGIHYSTDLNVTDVLDYDTWWNGMPKTDWVGTMAPTFDNAGSGTPRWSGTWVNTFAFGDFSTSFTAYYHSHLRQYIADVGDNFCVGPFITGFPIGGAKCTAKSFIDLDWTVRYNVTDSVEVNGTMRNVFDSKPPINPLGAGPTMNDGAIDQMGLVGRFFEVGVKIKN